MSRTGLEALNWDSPRFFYADDLYDVSMASDSYSRFGAYLRSHSNLFLIYRGKVGDLLAFATASWKLAQFPMIDPPYVKRDSRILGAFDYWTSDGHLEIVAHFQQEIEHEIPLLIDATALPSPAYDWLGEPDVETAKEAVKEICRQLNTGIATALSEFQGVA